MPTMTNFYSLPLELRQQILREAVKITSIDFIEAAPTNIRKLLVIDNISMRIAKYTEQCQELWRISHSIDCVESFYYGQCQHTHPTDVWILSFPSGVFDYIKMLKRVDGRMESDMEWVTSRLRRPTALMDF
jgi:hypothetical protein